MSLCRRLWGNLFDCGPLARYWRCQIRTVIDLFAGSGGLALGLERAGFETVFVNELNRHAMETYLSNRERTGLRAPNRHASDILELTGDPARLETFAQWVRREYGDVSLVVGGPPCQGYSGIGHRRSFSVDRHDVPSNHLYKEMAKTIAAVAPKAFLFENVAGLLTARWRAGGEPAELWDDVLETFSTVSAGRGVTSAGYVVRWAKVHAKDYGVPQNRPRLLLVGIRSDITPKLGPSSGRTVAGGFLPEGRGGAPDLEDLLGDLVDPAWVPGGMTTSYPTRAATQVQREFRTRPDGSVARKGDPLTEQEYSKHSAEVLSKFAHMLRNNGEVPPDRATKKFAQRVMPPQWGPLGPTLTATSLPDDFVHFSQPRTPTVREWARLQTFPDWYQFVGPRTTGGRRRAGDPDMNHWVRELPRYTQIGNAVPVRLAQEVGRHLIKLLDL